MVDRLVFLSSHRTENHFFWERVGPPPEAPARPPLTPPHVTSDMVKVVFTVRSHHTSGVSSFCSVVKIKWMNKSRMWCHHEGALGFKSQEMMRKSGFTLGKLAQLVSENLHWSLINIQPINRLLVSVILLVMSCAASLRVTFPTMTALWGVMGSLPTWCTQGAKTWVFPSCQEAWVWVGPRLCVNCHC